MTEAELMMDLFQGSDLAHGRAELTGGVSTKGKHEAKCWTEKKPATLADFRDHLEGRRGLGLSPIASTNMVRWGAIDVDVYNGLSLETLNAEIIRAGLPLVLCRSKSGGPHIYLFLSEWVPAKAMIEKLENIAAFLGFGDSEIFPKQAMISQSDREPDFGNWINLPYFSGGSTGRYGLRENNEALHTFAQFHEYAKARRLDAKQFRALKAPEPEEALPDGPPCLNRLFAMKTGENRNVILANAAVWAKKAKGEEWEQELDRLNALFPQPLGSSEVEALKKSYSKKDYRYQCNKTPLCSFCDSTTCRQKKFGVGDGALMPSSRSLTKVDTNPPIWYLDVTLADGTDHRISLTTEQLQTPRLFQRRCMETIHSMPPTLKAEDWQPIVEQLMKHVTVISIPPEMSPEGVLVETVTEFLNARASEASFEDLLRGLPFKNADGFHFRMKDLMAYLRGQRMDTMKQHEIIEVLRNRLGARKGQFKKIAGTGVNYVTVPLSPDKPEPLATPDQSPAY